MKNAFISSLLIVILVGSLHSQTLTEEAKKRVQQVKAENQPCADLGNGYYKNPIMQGNYTNPTIVKVGKDYYMAFEPYMAFERNNGLMLWHSRDLVNWEPIIRHTVDDLDRILAMDLQLPIPWKHLKNNNSSLLTNTDAPFSWYYVEFCDL